MGTPDQQSDGWTWATRLRDALGCDPAAAWGACVYQANGMRDAELRLNRANTQNSRLSVEYDKMRAEVLKAEEAQRVAEACVETLQRERARLQVREANERSVKESAEAALKIAQAEILELRKRVGPARHSQATHHGMSQRLIEALGLNPELSDSTILQVASSMGETFRKSGATQKELEVAHKRIEELEFHWDRLRCDLSSALYGHEDRDCSITTALYQLREVVKRDHSKRMETCTVAASNDVPSSAVEPDKQETAGPSEGRDRESVIEEAAISLRDVQTMIESHRVRLNQIIDEVRVMTRRAR